MKKSNFLVIPFSFISAFSFSQDLSHDVIAAQGDFNQIENMTLEWTIGEAFDESFFTKNRMYTQGFHQPFLTTVRLDIVTPVDKKFSIALYPNPVESFLHIKIDQAERFKLNIKLFDVTGKFIKEQTISEADKDITLDVNELPSGIYLLKFINTDDGSLFESHRIIKY